MAGYLLLCGGGEFQKGQEQADLFALKQGGGNDASVFIVTAGAGCDLLANQGVNWFRSLGANKVEALPLKGNLEADQPDSARKLSGANLIYLAGSNPVDLLETLKDSRAWVAIREAFAGGAMLGGAVAGGMVLMEHFYNPVNNAIEPGLGLFPNTIFVPQFNGVGRKTAPQVQKALPQALLIGIDEKVAIAGRGNEWQVFGRGWITIYRQGKPFKYQGGQPFKMIP